MLSLNPTSLAGENVRAAPFCIAVSADADYTSHDLAVNVKALPSQGMVLKDDGITPVVLGQLITAAELAALTFTPAAAQTGSATGSTIEHKPDSWFVVSMSQNSEPRPIGIQALEISAEADVTIIELPANGTVLLTDGATPVVQGQTLSLAQLKGLIFAPAADASGKISILQYRSGGSAEAIVTGGVLLVVGPDAPPMNGPTVIASAGSDIVAPLAVALLLDAALSSSTAVASSAEPDEGASSDAPAPNSEHAILSTISFSDQVLAPP
ncbi:MAG: large repetitive protein, partial [Bradyrhizobium sp.]|nr:large repetitive protein [Bradyrhizobium sp.]